ncbi:MAG: molybdopterin-dependent oxidoreductase, partial [Chloroflexi bacterium]|nr:molybdopterin-dependent oxidoreductase [Chloroflexota bacterium]
QSVVLAGLRRDDLFTIVLEQFPTDTTDYADYVLPATTQLEHWDILKPYGHHILALNRPAIAPLGQALPNSEIFRRLAAALGYDEPCFRQSDTEILQEFIAAQNHPTMNGITWERLLDEGFARIDLPQPYLPFADGHFPTPSGKCELYSQRMADDGFDPLPAWTPPNWLQGPDQSESPQPLAKHVLSVAEGAPRTQRIENFASFAPLREKSSSPTPQSTILTKNRKHCDFTPLREKSSSPTLQSTIRTKDRKFCDFAPLREISSSPISNPQSAIRNPQLLLISPPAHNFLNTTFANLERFIRREGEPLLWIHPDDAAPRKIAEGDTVLVSNDRGRVQLRARMTTDLLPGVVLAPTIWWNKLSPDRRNVNQLTSQDETDMGGSPTFYDVLVQVQPLPEQSS